MGGTVDRVTFGRVDTTYVMPRGHPAVHNLRRRGEEALHDYLSGALAETFARTLPRDNPSVWIIRELTVDFPFAAERDDAPRLASTWAREIAQSLTRTIRIGDGVTRFPNRAAFLAQYVTDVAAGRDRDCWYYAQFDSLGALPASAAIREVIVRESDLAADVVLELARTGRLEQVLRAIGDRSALAICDAAFPADDAVGPSPRLVEVLLALADGLSMRGDDGSIATPHNAIRLVVEMHKQYGEQVALTDIRVHVDRVLAFAALLARVGDPWRLIEALADGDARAAVDIASGSGFVDLASLEWLGALALARPDVITCAASTIARSTSIAPAVDAVPSAFTGLALLLPSLVETGLFAGDCAADAALRTIVALKCAGSARAGEVLRSPILTLFSGPEHRVDREIIRDLTARDATADPPEAEMGDADRDYLHLAGIEIDDVVDAITTSAAHVVISSFASRLLGFGGSSLAWLFENFCAGDGELLTGASSIVVQLPPVALEVVLRMAGFHDKTFSVPWLPDRPVTLRLGGLG